MVFIFLSQYLQKYLGAGEVGVRAQAWIRRCTEAECRERYLCGGASAPKADPGDPRPENVHPLRQPLPTRRRATQRAPTQQEEKDKSRRATQRTPTKQEEKTKSRHATQRTQKKQAKKGKSTQGAGSTCPRTSPPACAAVCRFTYHLPASRSAACAALIVAEPLKGLSSGAANGCTTGAFFPTSAGP